MVARGERILKDIKDYIAEARAMFCPSVQNYDLEDNGSLFYMNRENDTYFSLVWRGETPHFRLFYKDDMVGFADIFLTTDDTVMGALLSKNSESEEGKVHFLTPKQLEKGDALYFASLLHLEADKKEIWDMPVEEIDFSRELDEGEYLFLSNSED